MLTVRKLQVSLGDGAGALEAAKYSLDFADSPDAFASAGGAPQGGGRANTMWLGSSEALALLGVERGAEVKVEELALALQGQGLDGGQKRRPGSIPALEKDGSPRLSEDGREYRELVVNSWELTFGVPKSVSALLAMLLRHGHTELRAKVERGIVEAANVAVEHVLGTRPVIGGRDKRPAVGFAGSAALHMTARPARGRTVPDPHAHVHLIVVGILDEAGKLKTPTGEGLYKHSAMREAGAVGRAHLAEVLRRVGFEIEAGTGRDGRYFELVGVPRELCDWWSGRTRDVKAWVAEVEGLLNGELDNHERARGAVATRQSKSTVAPEVTLDAWGRAAARFGFGPAKVAELIAGPAAQLGSSWPQGVELEPDDERELGLDGVESAEVQQRRFEELRDDARMMILRRVWAEGPVISIGALNSIAYEYAARGLTPEQCQLILKQMQDEGELLALDGWQVTTRYIRGHEQYVRDVVLKTAQRPAVPLSDAAVTRGIEIAERALDGTLEQEQRDAVIALTRGIGWSCLSGYAGTGKGPVLQAVAEAHRLEGWQVIACAVDGSTSHRLGKQVQESALTFQRLLSAIETGAVQIDERTLLIVDEASKAGLGDWTSLAQLVDASGAAILPVGDIGQPGAVECPGMFEVMLKEQTVPSPWLDTVRRHRDPLDRTKPHPWLADYQKLLYRGNATSAIQMLRDHGALNLLETRDEAMLASVNKWEQRRKDHGIAPEDAIIVVPGSNDDVDLINELAQDRRFRAGELDGEGLEAVDRTYKIYAGDVVMLRETAYRPTKRAPGEDAPQRVENGTTGIVDSVDRERDCVVVTFDQPEGGKRTVEIDFGQLRRQLAQRDSPQERVASLRLSYAAHPFPVLGATYDSVVVLWGHGTHRKKIGYGSDTRARLYLDGYLDRESIGKRSDTECYEAMAKRLQQTLDAQASITYQDTPETSVSAPLADHDPIPTFRPRTHNQPSHNPEQNQELDQPETDTAITIPNPLHQYERLLGPDRLAPIDKRAEALSEEMTDLTDQDLQTELNHGRDALQTLDREAAIAARLIERDQILVAKRADKALAQARALETQAKTQNDPSANDLLQEAEVQRDILDFEELALQSLLNRELQLRETNRHPDDWIKTHQEPLARAIAAQRQALTRQALQQHQQPHPHPPHHQLENQPTQNLNNPELHL